MVDLIWLDEIKFLSIEVLKMQDGLVFGNTSFIHKLSPITKLIAVLLFWATALLSFDMLSLGVMILVAIIAWVVARLPLSSFKPILIVTGIILTIMVTLNGFLYYGGEEVLFRVFGAPFYKEGMLFGIVIGLKILTVVTVFPVLTATTPMPVFMAGLAKIHMPYKVIFTLGMAFRLVPLVNTTYQDITEAQQLRGHDLKSMPFFKKLTKGYIPLFVPLIVTLLRRAGDLDIAIESRGFGGQQERTYLSEITMGWRDWIFLSVFLVTFGFVLYLLFFGGGQGWFEYIDPT